ncbi:hypothetical protein LAJ61_00645 [Moraxella osloensis]|nr:hypothetical protein LAJ61_00645 [Moraxella osloensis]
MILSCPVAAGVVFCVAVVPLLSLAVICAALLVVSVLFVAEVLAKVLTELLAEVLTVADIIGVCAPQAGTTPTLTKVIAKRMGVKRNSECLDTLDWIRL